MYNLAIGNAWLCDSLALNPLNKAALESDISSGTRRARYLGATAPAGKEAGVMMTYVMTKPCPICKQQLTKKVPTDTVQCACGKHIWQG